MFIKTSLEPDNIFKKAESLQTVPLQSMKKFQEPFLKMDFIYFLSFNPINRKERQLQCGYSHSLAIKYNGHYYILG
jgi:hypothetical protein